MPEKMNFIEVLFALIRSLPESGLWPIYFIAAACVWLGKVLTNLFILNS